VSDAEQYPEKIRQCHNKLMTMQANRLNEMELEIGTKSLRALEKMIKHLSKSGDGEVLRMALEERNRISEYLYSINK